MKKIEAIMMALMMLVPIFLVGAMIFGLISMLFTEPSTFLKIAIYIAILAGVIFGVGYIYSKSKILQSISEVVIPIGMGLIFLWILGAMAYSFLHMIFG